MSMDLQTFNPSDVLKKISEELKEKFDEAGMHQVADFIDTLEEAVGMIEEDPKLMLNELQDLVEAFKDKIRSALDDPVALAPVGGLAGCGGWYGSNVVGKLRGLSDEAEDLSGTLNELVAQIVEPMRTLGETLNAVLLQLETTIKKLAKLPVELQGLAASVRGHADLAKIDTKAMRGCLDTGVSRPLGGLSALSGPLKDAIAAVRDGVETLIAYVRLCPTRVKGCFDVPAPLCFLQGTFTPQAPTSMTDLLDILDSMEKVNLTRLQQVLVVGENMCDFDPDTLSEPVKKFAESATGHVNDLDELVTGAKLATGSRPASRRGALCKMLGGA